MRNSDHFPTPERRGAPPPGDSPLLQFHPLAAHFPMMDRASPEFRGLVASIQATGLWEAITLHEGKVLDGRNRLIACEEAGVEPRFKVFDDSEQSPLEFVLARNLYRRHLTEGQRAMKAEEMVTTTHGGDRKSEHQDIKRPNGHLIGEPVVTIDDAAKQWCVNPRAVRRASFVRAHTETTPKIVAAVEAGTMTIGLAHALAKKTPSEQRNAPVVKFGGRKPGPKVAARPAIATVTAIKVLTDEQYFALVTRDLHRINRGAAREGMEVTIGRLRGPGRRSRFID